LFFLQNAEIEKEKALLEKTAMDKTSTAIEVEHKDII
jgi:hypothetical protein